MGGGQHARPQAMRRGPTLIVRQLGMPPASGGATPPATMDGDAEEPDARLDDLGEVGDRGLLDMIEGQLAAAARAGRLFDGDLDGGLGELLGSRGLATLEDPLPGLAAGLLGVLLARPLGERRRLPLARARQLLDLGLQGRDLDSLLLEQAALLEDEGHQLVASQFGEVGFRHDRESNESAALEARGSLINYVIEELRCEDRRRREDFLACSNKHINHLQQHRSPGWS